jgi:predicted 3-demethylubiquinone-9 3-methyltransferase (glyoxalase superfamily)
MYDGQAEATVPRLSTSAFEDPRIVSLGRHGEGGPGAPATAQRAVFSVEDKELAAVDSPVRHEFAFTPAIPVRGLVAAQRRISCRLAGEPTG